MAVTVVVAPTPPPPARQVAPGSRAPDLTRSGWIIIVGAGDYGCPLASCSESLKKYLGHGGHL